MADTLLLDTVTWDLVLDISGNIALASDPYSMAQDAASAIRLFEGELWYNTVNGVPYWTAILGRAPPLSLIKAKFIAAALTVPGVVAAQCFISGYRDRVLTGQVQIIDENNNTSLAGF